MASLAQHLDRFSAELAPNHIKGLKHRADAVVAAVDLQTNLGASSSAASDWIDGQSLQHASAVVAEHTKGLQELQKHLRKMVRDMTILTSSSGSDASIMIHTA